jgi:hypothetical protein
MRLHGRGVPRVSDRMEDVFLQYLKARRETLWLEREKIDAKLAELFDTQNKYENHLAQVKRDQK